MTILIGGMQRSRGTMQRWAMLLACLALASACSDDGKVQSPSSAASHCSPSTLEADLEADPLAGPGVDPATGKLLFAPGSSYVVSSTYIVPKAGPDGASPTAQYEQLFPPLLEQLQQESGLLAIRLGTSDSCRSGRTLAIWKSEADMYHFVTSRAHAAAMKAVNDVAEPGFEVVHWTATSPEQTTWSEAMTRLAGGS
jgi:heme-degrading monooxygenase HmoA